MLNIYASVKKNQSNKEESPFEAELEMVTIILVNTNGKTNLQKS